MYTNYQNLKKEKNEQLDKNPKIAQLFTQKLSYDLLWNYLLTTNEGYNLLVQIPNIVTPEAFDSLLDEIDATIQSIEEYK